MTEGFFNTVRQGKLRRLQSLVKNGLDLRTVGCGRDGQTALMVAMHIDDEARRWRIFHYLARHANPAGDEDRVTQRDLLTWACFLDRTREALWILRTDLGDLDLQRQDLHGRTSLHYAAVNGNVELLHEMLEYMQKYSLDVDIRDSDGFTPYILACRMGHGEAAAMLASAGASAQQMDSKNKRTATEWAWMREREKSYAGRKSDDRRLATYKVLGRLPAIKAAGFKPEHIKIVASKVDRHLLDEDSDSRADTSQFKSHKLYKQNTWLDYDKLKARHLRRSMPDLTGIHSNPMRLFKTMPPLHETTAMYDKPTRSGKLIGDTQTKTKKPIMDIYKPTLDTKTNIQRKHNGDSEYRIKHKRLVNIARKPIFEIPDDLDTYNLNGLVFKTYNRSQANYKQNHKSEGDDGQSSSIHTIMSILESQCSASFRPVAKTPAPPPSPPASTVPSRGRQSLEGGRQRSSRKQRNNVRRGSRRESLATGAYELSAPSSAITVITEEE